jgi:competence protein ComEA
MFKRLMAAMLALFAAAAFAAVDVNKATQADLDGIKGIGPAIATKIMDERKKGSFKDWQDFIERVKGVGEGNAAKFSAEGLTVNGSGFKGAAAAPAAAMKKDDKPAATAAAPAPAAKKEDKAMAAPAAAAPAAAAKPVADAKPDPKAQAKADKQAKADADKKAKEEKKAKAEAAKKDKMDKKEAKPKAADAASSAPKK